MNSGNDIALNNGLCISVDWLSFTIKKPMSWQNAISHFGLNIKEFKTDLLGAYGYKSRVRHMIYPISFLYDGNDNMGIHVTVSGSAVRYFLDCYFRKYNVCETPFDTIVYEVDSFDDTILGDVLKDILDIGQLSRLDLAIDDKGSNYYTLDEVCDIFRNGLYTSKFKEFEEIYKGGKGYSSGRTLNLGSRESDISVRIYDKQLERNSKKRDSIDFSWVRWELELHGNRACAVAVMLVAGKSLSDVTLGIFKTYLRFIIKDNIRDTRCSTDPKWELFLDGIRKIKLCQPKVEKSIEDKRDWLKKQVAPTVAALYEIDGDLSFFYDLIESGSSRLSAELRNLIDKFQKDIMGDNNDFI